MSNWWEQYDEREMLNITHARWYAENTPGAGAVGHNLYLLIARMAGQLDAYDAAIAGGQKAPPPAPARPHVPLSDKQKAAIYAIGKGTYGWDDAAVEQETVERFGCTPGMLSKEQASEWIDALKNPRKADGQHHG